LHTLPDTAGDRPSILGGILGGMPRLTGLLLLLLHRCDGVAPAKTPPLSMPVMQLAGTDLHVSRCCLGGMTWGAQNTDSDAASQLSMVWDCGVNFVDTAEGYPVPMKAESFGKTDIAIGKWMRATKRPRDSVVISTKVSGYNERYTWMRESGEGTRLTRAQIIESVEGSLRRLGVDEIDLLQLHWPERRVQLTGQLGSPLAPATKRGAKAEDAEEAEAPVQLKERALGEVTFEEQAEALHHLVQSGKVRHWGLSNENSEGVRSFRAASASVGLSPPAVVQNAYSLLQRADELNLIPETFELGAEETPCSYLAYSPLSGGVLTGKYQPADARSNKPGTAAKAMKRSRLGLFRGYSESFKKTKGPQAVTEYMQVAKRHGVTPSQLAIAHCNSRDFVAATVIGATSLAQLAENMMGFQVEWTQEMEDDVLAVYRKYPDPWRVQIAGGG